MDKLLHNFSMGGNYSPMPHFDGKMSTYIQISYVYVITYSCPNLDDGLTSHFQ